jgi:hypothetical protein
MRLFSRKGARGAKFGQIKVGFAKKKWLRGEVFACLASWREKNSEEVSPAKAQSSPSSSWRENEAEDSLAQKRKVR